VDTVTLESGEVISKEFYEKLNSVSGKRARFVIDTIMKKGNCSTEDLKDAGYEHAPRAKRDVVEAGIPINTGRGKDRDGRRMAIYSFGNWEEYKQENVLSKTKGRNNLSGELKKKLLNKYGNKCALYNEFYDESLLQIDHRVPYEIGGDPEDMMDLSKFMLLSPSANRAKSWACEHCDNWIVKKIAICETCYYAHPENYEHIAEKQERCIDVLFRGDDEISLYNKIKKKSLEDKTSIQEAFKSILKSK